MENQNKELAQRAQHSNALAPFEPASMTELIEFSKQLAESSLVPSHFQKKPANIVVAVGLGKALGLTAFQAVQDIMVVNGKPSLYGDLPKALVEQSGLLEDFQEYSSFEALKNEMGKCIVKRKGKTRVKESVFTIEMAKRAGLWGKEGPWSQYPGRMLQLKARSEALRDEFPDILKGFKIAEDIINLDPTAPDSFAMPTEAPADPAPIAPAAEGEIVDAEVVDQAAAPVKSSDEPISGDQRAAIFADLNAAKVDPAKFKEFLRELGFSGTAEIRTSRLPEVVAWIQKQKR